MIDKSRAWWKGKSFDDLRDFMIEFTGQELITSSNRRVGYGALRLQWGRDEIDRNHRADVIRQIVCKTCGGTRFGLQVDHRTGFAERVCSGCGAADFIADSGEWCEAASPGGANCPCGAADFEIGVGFSLIESGEIKWIGVGCRCVACDILGVYAEWKVHYEPSRHLLDLV